jgi:hypothetical protein
MTLDVREEWMKSRELVVAVLAGCLVLQGCATSQGASDNTSTSTPASAGGTGGKTTLQVVGGLLGGALGVVAATALANSEGKRLKLSPAEVEKRKRGYLIAFALVGAAGGAALGGTVYGKLQEGGRKERENALLAAAQQARPQRYGEPTNPALTGTVTPTRRYADAGANRDCVDVEDALAEGTSRDAIFVKMCRSLPNGGWQQVTA